MFFRACGLCAGVVVLAGFCSFGFSGSRRLAGPGFRLCRFLASRAAGSGCAVLTGCVSGADAAARIGAGAGCRVFSVSSGAFGSGRAAFVRRSVAFVRALSVSPSPVLCVFPGAVCPSGLVPSSASRACFAGFGSGSWACAAFASGLGVPVVVFGFSLASLPASWGCWSSAPGVLSGGFILSPSQLSLF